MTQRYADLSRHRISGCALSRFAPTRDRLEEDEACSEEPLHPALALSEAEPGMRALAALPTPVDIAGA